MLVLVVVGFAVYFFWPQGSGTIAITVREGQTTRDIAEMVSKQSNALHSQLLFGSAALVGRTPIVPGEYTVRLPARYTQVWEQLYSQSADIASKPKTPKRLEISVTFPEGQTVDQMLNTLSRSGYSRTEELKTLWTSYSRLLAQNFPFLPPDLRCQYGQINTCVKYYLEGYLAPDTYQFFADEDPGSVTKKILDNFARRNPQLIQKNSQEIYDIVTLASVIEKETGRPGGNIKDALLKEERELVAGVFNNRDAAGMMWQSDPTVTYGTGKVLCQAFREIEGCAAINDPVFTSSLYNTYKLVGKPIGPIANASSDVITAALNPKESDYLFFIADISGKKYFAVTYQEHLRNIAKLESINEQLRSR